ncbi:MAG: SDR family NAD(P)-dependent oxidoreductase [Mogibacterium sp.]|nr:SDR family NAD(P)-dependent oxidoreductase [Mogibacterium sp.]MBQ6501557.1 SDR family NAD(P)-dependent oxidoreductase [Mogibacterium sp.]
MKDFKGRVAVITGAANGFGFEFVKEAAKRGMKILAVDIEGDEVLACEPVAKELGAKEIVCLQADVSLLEDTEKIVKTAMEKFGQIDLLINNAGTGKGGTISNLPLRDWEWMVYANLMSHVYMMRQVIPIMMKQGTHCNILNVCSIAGLITSNAMPGYYSTKHAAVQLSRATQYELEEIGADIQVSIFCPGFVQTDLHHAERHRPARFSDPTDPYYQSAEFMASEKASEYVVTTGLPIDGFGETVFKGIEDDQFYIVTHPQYDPLMRKQIYDRVDNVNPDLRNVGKQRKPVESGDRDLTGRVALITGAAYGFGKEFVKEAAKRKMKIVAVDIMEDELMKLEAVAKEHGAEDITLIPADVSLYEETEKVVKATMDKYGQIDLLMNNAGTCTPGYGFMIPLQDWEWIIRTNFLSHVYFMRQVIPIMKAQGTHCNIMNTCSVAGLITSTGMCAYYVTKNAAVALSECIEYEMQEAGADIHLSVFCPGFVRTNFDHADEYRPARYAHGDDPFYESEMFKKGKQSAAFVIGTGYPIEPFGAHVFEAVEKDQFYIVTHREYDEHIKSEVDQTIARTNPKVVPIGEAIKDVTNLPGGPLRGYLK